MKILSVVLGAIVFIVLVALIGTFFFWIGWNIFISPVFALPPITLWQAFCAMLIIGIVGGALKSNIQIGKRD